MQHDLNLKGTDNGMLLDNDTIEKIEALANLERQRAVAWAFRDSETYAKRSDEIARGRAALGMPEEHAFTWIGGEVLVTPSTATQQPAAAQVGAVTSP
jgi:hypothetical protein